MLTEVMLHDGLARPPIDAGLFHAVITGGRLIALMAYGKNFSSSQTSNRLQD